MKHLDDCGETYFVHMVEAWMIVISLIVAALACAIHSIIPQLFKKTASSIIREVLGRTDKRYARKV